MATDYDAPRKTEDDSESIEALKERVPDKLSGAVDVEVERPKRVRSPSDVLRLLVGAALVLLGVILATVADRTVGGAQADLVEAVSRLPSRVEQVVVGILVICRRTGEGILQLLQ